MKFILEIVICCISLKFAIAQGGNASETVVINPAFEEVAPCACDLTRGSCDLSCCCDSECSTDVKSTFASCTPSLPGGLDAPSQEYDCRSDHHNKADWFPLLCVEFEYNAFLGYYHQWEYKISAGLQAFLDRLATVVTYWYREDEPRLVEDNLPAGGYAYGVRVKTVKATTQHSGILTIPQPILSGQCLETAPVQYLKDLDVSCSYEMTQSLCSDSSVLSALFYVQSSTSTFFSVLEGSGLVVAETNVNYLCATDASSYIRNNVVNSAIVPGTTYLFNYAFPANASCIDECGNDICVDLSSLPMTAPAATANLPGNCVSQDPSALTPTPVVGGVCQNAVLDVEYTIQWNDSRITKLDANIILGNVPLTTQNVATVLTQKYKTTFVHNFTGESAQPNDNFYNIVDTTYARSGRPGYDIGKLIHSGSKVTDATVTPPEFKYVTTDPSRQMAVFNPANIDGLCLDAGRRSLRFGEDIFTGCQLRLGLADFTNCSDLRKMIINRLNNLMPSDVLGRRGYHDPNDLAYWVDVVRDDLSMLCIASEYFPLGLSPVDSRTGICRNITSGIHLDVLYAETGRSNDYPIYEILGSKVNYTVSTWEVSCSGPDGSVCRPTAADTQPFYLTSSARFIKVPAQTPEPVAKYYLVPEEDDVQLCPGDRCWDNLFYPLTGRYTADSYEYAFGMFALIIVFIIAYLFVTRPWW